MIQRKRQKKNEEMKREAELRKKFEENLDKPITITQRQLMEAQAHVMAKGYFERAISVRADSPIFFLSKFQEISGYYSNNK